MLIRAEDSSVFNLIHIERLEIASSNAIGNAVSGESTGNAPDAEETFVLRAFIAGQPHDLVGPTANREEAETALNRIFNMVSERADLHRPGSNTPHR